MAKLGRKGSPLADSVDVAPEMPEIPDPPASSAEELPVVRPARGAGAGASANPNPTIVPARRTGAPAPDPKAEPQRPTPSSPGQTSPKRPDTHPRPAQSRAEGPETKRPAAAKTTGPKIPVPPTGAPNKPWNPFGTPTPAAVPGAGASSAAPATAAPAGPASPAAAASPPTSSAPPATADATTPAGARSGATARPASAAGPSPASGSASATASGNTVRYLLGYAAGSALAILLLVIALVGARGKSGELESKLRGLERENEILRVAPASGPADKGVKTPPGELERLAGELERARQQIAALQREIDGLRRQNTDLAARLERPAEAASPWTPPPAAPPGPPPPGWTSPPPPVAPPDPGSYSSAADQYPGEGTGEAWGASEDGELDEMASVLKLNPEQREVVKRIIMDGQSEFERALIALGQSGERDITAIERIGEDISRRTQERIRQVLYPEQQAAFRELMQQKEGER